MVRHFWSLDGDYVDDYNEEEDDGVPPDIPDDDDEDNPNKVEPIPKSSAFFIFSHTNR